MVIELSTLLFVLGLLLVLLVVALYVDFLQGYNAAKLVSSTAEGDLPYTEPYLVTSKKPELVSTTALFCNGRVEIIKFQKHPVKRTW